MVFLNKIKKSKMYTSMLLLKIDNTVTDGLQISSYVGFIIAGNSFRRGMFKRNLEVYPMRNRFITEEMLLLHSIFSVIIDVT